MTRRWALPKPQSPQQQLRLEQRRDYAPPVKIATDTSVDAAVSVGIVRGGDLAGAMVDVLQRHSRRVKLGRVMLALTVRREVLEWLLANPEGATADGIAVAIGRGILTVRPRVAELHRMCRVSNSGRRGVNASGRRAIVWVAAEPPTATSESPR